MAQDGDTITYTYSDGTSVAEDVSAVDEMTIDHLDGAGGQNDGGNGGRVENVVVDLSSYDTIYLWVASYQIDGRYEGGLSESQLAVGLSAGSGGGGSTEVAFVNTDASESSDEPFIAGAGGGGGNGGGDGSGGGGARGGVSNTGEDGSGTPPPQGGDANSDGNGAVAAISEIIDSGTTTLGGGSSPDTEGEIQISYRATTLAAPTNLQLSLQ